MNNISIARVGHEQRQDTRRINNAQPVLATFHTFANWERDILKRMERRRTLRRQKDVKQRLAHLG